MISDRKDGIEAKCDTQESRNNSRNKESQEYQNQKEKSSSSSQSVRSHEHLNNIKRCPKPWTYESRVVRSDLMSVCVCVKRKVLVHDNNITNNNMIN